MKYAIMMDFGSTYTKVVCVDVQKQKVIVTDKVPSTVSTDAAIGLNQCYERVEKHIGKAETAAALKLATSSAAGGLRMAVIGLTKSQSNKAGRNACFSAGAKIVCNENGFITSEDLQEIIDSDAEILLFCGGYEKGNTETVLKNAETICRSNLMIPVIYAGNSKISSEVRKQFSIYGKECYIAENIMPEIGLLNTEPTSAIIRNIFMMRITNMKGVGTVQEKMDAPIVPTPLAVLKAGELLSRGTEEETGLGAIMMADIGGATTDIYSYIENTGYQGAKQIGSQEPFAKRTVEGDMGMRESSVCLLQEIGEEQFCETSGETKDFVEAAIKKRITEREYIADNDRERRLDVNIAANALRISARRHAGRIEKGYGKGMYLMQYGKNLTNVKTIIGTGGIIVNAQNPGAILKHAARREDEDEGVLLPEELNTLIDREYVLYAAGLLSDYDKAAALKIMKHSLKVE